MFLLGQYCTLEAMFRRRLMTTLRLIPCALALSLCVSFVACKKEQTKPTAPAKEDIVAGAIELAGGVGVLKKGSTFSARYKAEQGKVKIKGTIRYRHGSHRLKYFNPAGDTPLHQVAGISNCWLQYDKAVIPCPAEERAHAARLAGLFRAAHIWPLKTDKSLSTRPGTEDVAGKKFKTLTVSADQELGTLLLDPDNYRVVGLKMQTKLEGKARELKVAFTKFEKNCGAVVPTKREYALDGKAYMVEEISGLICEGVKEAAMAEPKQVEHLKVDLKHTANVNLACLKLKGSLDGLGAALDKIGAKIKELGYITEGPAQIVHRKGPPRAAARWVTDVCYPVEDKAWHAPKGTWKGEWSLFERLGDEYLRVFGIGDYTKNTPTLAATLKKEARKMKRKQVRSMVQVLYMHPDSKTPVKDHVSEMHLPMD